MQSSWRSQYTRYKDFFLTAYQSYTKKEEVRMYLEVLLSLFTSVIFIIFALKPTVITIIDLTKTIKEKTQTLANLDQKVQNLKTATDLFEQQQNAITATLTSVPDGPQAENFTVQIQGLSNQDGVNLSGVLVEPTAILGTPDVKAPTPGESVSQLPDNVPGLNFSFNVSSNDYNTLLTFLTDLKKLRRAIKIDSAKLSSENVGSTTTLSLAIVGRTAYLSTGQ